MSALGAFALATILVVPALAAALLALLPGYRLTARLNVVASLATFLSALSLFVIERPSPGPYVLIALIVVGVFLFRIRERFDTVDVHALDRFRGERQ